MLVYRSTPRSIDGPATLRRLGCLLDAMERNATPDDDLARALVIEAGELEAGVVDALSVDADRTMPLERLCRRVSVHSGAVLRRCWQRESAAVLASAVQSTYHSLQVLCTHDLPSGMKVSIPEGYAYYCVYPESYIEAAVEAAGDLPPGARAAVVGLRGIGTSLSAVVAAALRDRGIDVETWTVRPRGHPFSRSIALDSTLQRAWRQWQGARWLLVDEGPGLSGSSLGSAAVCLSALGVRDEAIVLMPNWAPDPSRWPTAIADTWRRHRVVPAPFERVAARALPDCVTSGDALDISGGQWRAFAAGRASPVPLVHPGHERRKYIVTAGTPQLFVKFAGLGRYGARVAGRTLRAAEEGWTPAVLAFDNGFLISRYAEGRRLTSADVTPSFLEQACRYLAWLHRESETDPDPAACDIVFEMGAINVGESLGPAAATRFKRRVERLAPVYAALPLRGLDNRMMPHEWLLAGGRLLKTDGAEHDDDHFYPGVFDGAWDVAALIAEFALSGAMRAHVIDRYSTLSTDPSVAERLPIVMASYLAFRLGYARLAAVTLKGTTDGERWRRRAGRYRGQLSRQLQLA